MFCLGKENHYDSVNKTVTYFLIWSRRNLQIPSLYYDSFLKSSRTSFINSLKNYSPLHGDLHIKEIDLIKKNGVL